MRRVLRIPLALLFFVSFAHVNPVQACSGVHYDYWSLDGVLYEYSTIVVGRIHAVSDSAINAVLHIDKIIKGDPINEYIIFSRNRPEIIAFAAEGRGHPERCSIIGVQEPSGRRFIAGLWRSADDVGSYYGTIITEDLNGIFTVTDSSNPEITSLAYEEIIAYAAQQLNETPRAPQSGAMPRPAVVRLSTESGAIYELPIDQKSPKQITQQSETYCNPPFPTTCIDHVEAPNKIDSVSFYPPGSNPENYMTMDSGFATALEGEGGVYSMRSDLLAVWAGQEVQVYATARQSRFESDYYSIRLLRALTIDPDDSLYPGAGAWHPDGRTFAFSTETGVWLWDIMPNDSEPVLLLPTTSTPIIVRHFSPAGNFLAVESDSRRYHVDVNTLVEYPDGLFSPDDRLLAVYDTAASTLTPLQIHRLIPEFKPSRELGHYSKEIAQFEWFDHSGYIYAACGDPILEAETPPGFDKPWCKIRSSVMGWDNASWVDGISFDYDPVTKSLVTLIDGDTITFNGEVLEIGDIDSAIVDVELIPLIDLEYTKF